MLISNLSQKSLVIFWSTIYYIVVKNKRSGLNIFFSHFYFYFYLFSFILFLELGLGLEGQDHAVTQQVTSHITHKRT